MSFKSHAQRRFLEANPHRIGGKEKLQEWYARTPDLHALPERVGDTTSVESGAKAETTHSAHQLRKLLNILK